MIYGQPLTFGGSSEPELLWTNASPTSAFAAQTVNVATGYDAYLVKEGNGGLIVYVPVGGSARLWQYQSTTYAYHRPVSAADGSLVFSAADRMEHSYVDDDYSCIPTHIWGVKFTVS